MPVVSYTSIYVEYSRAPLLLLQLPLVNNTMMVMMMVVVVVMSMSTSSSGG